MSESTSTQCTVVILHSKKIRTTLFEILKRMKCEIFEITSLTDLLDFIENSDLAFVQFSHTSQENPSLPIDSLVYPKRHSARKDGSRDIRLTETIDTKTMFARESLPPTLSEMERLYIMSTLKRCKGNRKTAAKQLGIDRTTLYRKIKKYGITREHKG